LATTPHDAADQDVQERGSAKENHFCHLTSPLNKKAPTILPRDFFCRCNATLLRHLGQ
jgi:hypothetical protein